MVREWARGRQGAACSLVILLSGCATLRPSEIDSAGLVSVSAKDRQAAAISPPISGPLGLDEAVARALKYNLEQRVSMAEQAVASRQFDISKRELLPQVMATAGYNTRDEDQTRRSVDSVTGGPSNANPFISQERSHLVTELGVTWNLLDFGVGYYNAQQQANRILIAGERRRKVVHTLMQDVQSAFWRAYSAQLLRGEIVSTIIIAEKAVEDARIAEREKIRAPLDSLRFQRQLLENLRTLEALDQELSTAKLDLARLINVPMTTEFSLAEPAVEFPDDVLKIPVEQLEDLAITGNADLREQHYNVRNARIEARKAMARLFPRLSFDYGFNYDTDKFLINNSWNDAGINIAFNLLNIANIPFTKRLSAAGVALADQRRVATLMTIISQVHIARQQYDNARRLFLRTDELTDVERRIVDQMSNREAAAVQSQLETVTGKTSLIITLLRRYQALSAAYAAEGRIQATLGLDPGTAQLDQMSLDDLTLAVGRSRTQWRATLAGKGSDAR